MQSIEKLGEGILDVHSRCILWGRAENARMMVGVLESSKFRARVSAVPVAFAEVITSATTKFAGVFELAGRGVFEIALSPFKSDKFLRVGILYFQATLLAIGSLLTTILFSPIAIVSQSLEIIKDSKKAIPFEKNGLLNLGLVMEKRKYKSAEMREGMIMMGEY